MFAEIVVHRGIEHIAVQPVLGALPNFTDQETVRLCFFHCCAKSAPEGIVDLACHVQPPAVDIEFAHPVLAHVAKIADDLRVFGVRLGHHPLIAEALVGRVFVACGRTLHWELQPVEPVFVCRGFTLFDNVLKGKEVPSHMVKHTIDDHPHTQRVACAYQVAEILVCSKTGVDVEIVDQVVLVVFTCDENRVNINAVKAEIADVVEILRDPTDGPSELSVGDLSVPVALARLPADGTLC